MAPPPPGPRSTLRRRATGHRRPRPPHPARPPASLRLPRPASRCPPCRGPRPHPASPRPPRPASPGRRSPRPPRPRPPPRLPASPRRSTPPGRSRAGRAAFLLSGRRLLRLPVHPAGRRGRARGAVARRLHGAGLRERPVGGLGRADGRLLGVLLPHRHPGRDPRPQLVRRPHPLPRHPARPGQRLHHLGLQRADRQGRHGLLPEPAPPRAGLGGGLGDAVRHVLRGVLPAVLGHGRLPRGAGAAPGVRPGPVAGGGRGAGLRGVGALLPRRRPARQPPARPAHLPRVQESPPSGTTPCSWSCARRPCWPRWSCTRRR